MIELTEFNCPKCDKPLRVEEVNKKKCGNCEIELDINVKDVISGVQEKRLREMIEAEMFAVKKDDIIDHYETAINILKATFSNVVCKRNTDSTNFYLVVDGEIVDFLWKVVPNVNQILIGFDINLYKYTVNMVKLLPRDFKRWRGKLRSAMMSNDFVYMVEFTEMVYRRKFNKYHKGTKKVPPLQIGYCYRPPRAEYKKKKKKRT